MGALIVLHCSLQRARAFKWQWQHVAAAEISESGSKDFV